MNKFNTQRTAVNAAEDVRKLNEVLERKLTDGPLKDNAPLDEPTAAVLGQLMGEMKQLAVNYNLIVKMGYGTN